MKRTNKKPPPPSMLQADIPPDMSAQAIESAALGLRMFIDLGRLTLQRDRPQAYQEACQSIASGSAVETIVVRIRADSVMLSMCLLAPGSPLLFSISGRALAETTMN